MSFRIIGLDPGPFASLHALSDEAQVAQGVQRCTVNAKPGFPDRVELRDLEIGETALLLNYVHQDAPTPYRASHAIFVGERSTRRYDAIETVPEVLRLRPLSLRAFDARHMLHDACLAEGLEIEAAIDRLLGDARTAYIQAHFARPGCYAARIERA
jgi:hypothetical protein